MSLQPGNERHRSLVKVFVAVALAAAASKGLSVLGIENVGPGLMGPPAIEEQNTQSGPTPPR